MSFEILSTTDAKAYVKKPRMGRATFPFFNQELLTGGYSGSQRPVSTHSHNTVEDITDEG